MKRVSLGQRGSSAAVVLAVLLAPLAARADVDATAASTEPTPLLAGPVLLGNVPATFDALSYHVVFDDAADSADVTLVVQVRAAQEVVLGFAGNRVTLLEAELDGQPVTAEYSAVLLPVAGGPFADTRLVRVPPTPAGVRTVTLRARGETLGTVRKPHLTPPEASFLLNQALDGTDLRLLRLDPAAAAGARTVLRVETVSPQRPQAPIQGAPPAGATNGTIEGPVAAGTATPYEVAAVLGVEETPRHWSIAPGIGLALDFPHVQHANVNAAGAMTERWYRTNGFTDPTPRLWLSLTFRDAFDPHWIFAAGVEGDPSGVLEIPLTFAWYPQERTAPWGHSILDFHLLFGLAFQVFNDLSPGASGVAALDPRPFVRLGAGMRFFVLTAEVLYEIAPPVGDWNGPLGLLEHKLLFVFPFAL